MTKKEEFYRYAESLGIKINDAQRLMVLATESKEESIDDVLSEITRLQEKYDENGYDCSPMIKLQRIEQHIDAVINIKK